MDSFWKFILKMYDFWRDEKIRVYVAPNCSYFCMISKIFTEIYISNHWKYNFHRKLKFSLKSANQIFSNNYRIYPTNLLIKFTFSITMI